MSLGYKIYFNSGGISENTYEDDGNVSLIEISNSNQDYFQSGRITLYNVASSQSIGDDVSIYINNSTQFNGYVVRRESTIDRGRLVEDYQIIGRNYDLWRYGTDADAVYSGMTAFIVSSLIHDYVVGVSGGGITNTEGIELTEEIDLSYKSVGDAIIELTKLDGYRFYVSSNGDVFYYYPSASYSFTIEESDILDMSPIEESDDDLCNDVLVVGGTDYTTQTNVSNSHPSSSTIPSGVLVSQQFDAEDGVLSSVKLYLDRTREPNQPSNLGFEIWGNTSKTLFTDDFTDYTILDASTNTNMGIIDSSLILSGTTSSTEENTTGEPNGGGGGAVYYTIAQLFKFNTSGGLYYYQFHHPYTTGTLVNPIYYVCRTGATGYPNTGNMIASGQYDGTITTGGGGTWGPKMYLTQQPYMESGITYAIGLARNWDFSSSFSTYYANNNNYSKGYGLSFDTTPSPGHWWSHNPADYLFRVGIKHYSRSGEIETISYTDDTQYMKLDISGVVSSNSISISGTNSGSANWKTLTDNSWYNFGFEYNSGCRIKYKFSSNGNYTPKIDSSTLEIGDAFGSGSGVPKSGSKIEWSDDISFSSGDIPYPSSFSSWKSYTSPKLILTENDTYWMVLSHPSGSSKYWDYYYNPNSSYDGKICYSWDDGVNWSSNSTCPSLVPDGNISFNLGWETGKLTATATNQSSIDVYGRHYRIVNDTTLTTLEATQAKADYEVSGMEAISKNGTLVIDGRVDMSVGYRFSSNLSNFGVDELWEVVSYKQRIDREGFTTTINYNKHSWDLMKNVADLEKEVF